MGGGAWPFLVGGVICLVNSVNEERLGGGGDIGRAEFCLEMLQTGCAEFHLKLVHGE